MNGNAHKICAQAGHQCPAISQKPAAFRKNACIVNRGVLPDGIGAAYRVGQRHAVHYFDEGFAAAVAPEVAVVGAHIQQRFGRWHQGSLSARAIVVGHHCRDHFRLGCIGAAQVRHDVVYPRSVAFQGQAVKFRAYVFYVVIGSENVGIVYVGIHRQCRVEHVAAKCLPPTQLQALIFGGAVAGFQTVIVPSETGGY